VFLDEKLTVRAFAEAIVNQRLPGGGLEEPVANFLIDVRTRMPDYLRIPFYILTLIFNAWAIATTGRRFHNLSNAQRIAQIQSWRESRIEAWRRLIEFYETLAIFGLYSELYGEDFERGGRNVES